MTCFEDFSNELLFEIFDYLSFDQILDAFFSLTNRLNQVIRTYPACIDLTKALQRNLRRKGPFQCRSLVVSYASEQFFNKICSNINFQGIRSIELVYNNYSLILSLFHQLPMMQLESITIRDLHVHSYKENFGQGIWSMIATTGLDQLRYLNVPLRIISEDVKQFSFELLSLEHAILKDISDEEMFIFLCHTPNICMFRACMSYFNSDVDVSHLNLPRLTYLDFLTHFELRCWWYEKIESEMFGPEEWQNLIEQCLPNLLYLQVRFFKYVSPDNETYIEDMFENSDYWRNRQPHFRIQNDGVIAVPTDTIYGLAALVHSEQAIHRIHEMKGRSFTKPLAMAVGNIDDVFTWSKPTLSKEQLASENLLPGPVTLMFERQSSLPSYFNPNVTNIAIRIPDCQFMIDLAQRLKQPIALTSANISNEPSSVCIEEFKSLWSQVDLVVDAGLLASNDRRGSTIVDLSRKGYFQVQRQGIGYERIVRYLQEECHLQE
ncbi:unnamed protein product [Adineta steineri]|uniref:Threonylcarbamoyl-AMP synthase n=1 Tax=Adineta steineri TaxID=433720 RepID=A0A818KE21_9BILA|nr:unnamed protein product [Adineta steineri]CAF3552855.1 unnamed protein product [Adineta steineri]